MTDRRWSWQRLAGTAGILFAVWVVIVVVTVQGITGTPYRADSADYYRAYYVDNATLYHLITWFAALSWVFFFLAFASGVRTALGPADSASGGTWARLGFAGALLATAVGGSGLVFEEALSLGIASEGSDALVRALSQLREIIDTTVLNWGLAIFLVPAGLIIIRGGVFARWIGWLGLAGAALLVVGAAWPLSEDDQGPLALVGAVGLALFTLWVVAVSVGMLRMRAAADAE